MTPPTFSLIDEPWIRVRLIEGNVAMLSIRETLLRAPRIRSLAGEIPSQDAALLRMLLAILLSVARPPSFRGNSAADDLWASWWGAGSFPQDDLDSYLSARRERFDLLHPETPFMQVAGLTTDSGKRSGLGKLIADLPDGHQYFTVRAGRELDSLELAEAARWLVHCQAFDPSGIKTGAQSDPRVSQGKGYSFGYPAWSGNLGVVIIEGRNLFETLLLNLPLRTSHFDDLPVWDRTPLGPGVERPQAGEPVDEDSLRLPKGPADLFTWPSRRVRLFVEGDRVIDVQISNGDKRAPQNLLDREPMSAWHRSENQSKRGQDVYMPVMHDPARHVWQGLGSLLQNRDEEKGKVKVRRAAMLETLDDFRLNELLPFDHAVNLWTVGLAYGPQNSTIAGGIDDRLAASVAALTEPSLIQTAVDASIQAKDGVVALANLAGDLDRAAGGDGSQRKRTFEYGYALLDGPYRAWIRQLLDPQHIPSYRADWSTRARRVLERAAEQLVADAGPAAIVGRKVNQPGTDEKRLLDAGTALGRFHHKLHVTFPHPAEDR